MKITVLVENTTASDLQCEHGLSFLIEYKGQQYLLDAGQSRIFMDNAEVLKEDLSKVKLAVLSHSHYDHSGGFEFLLEKYEHIKVLAMKGVEEKYFSSKGGVHEIGVPQAVYPGFKERFVVVDAVTEIDDGVFLVPHSTGGLHNIAAKTGLYKQTDGKLVPDDFSHEASLVFEEEEGLVVFNSCSHGGICNIINEVKAAFPNKTIHTFLGGLHMMGTKDGEEYCTFSDDELIEIGKFLAVKKINKIYTGHCTGEVAFGKIQKLCRNCQIDSLTTGKVISL